MKFVKMRSPRQTREFVQQFGGLDLRVRIDENCFSEMKNMSGDDFPALATRARRRYIGSYENCAAMLDCGDEIAYIADNTLHYGKVEVALGEPMAGSPPRQIVRAGARLIVFPDGVYLNTADTEDKGCYRLRARRYLTNVQVALATALRLRGLLFSDGTYAFLTPQEYLFAHADEQETVPLTGVPNPETYPWYEVTGNGVTIISPNTGVYLKVKNERGTRGEITVTNKETGESVVHTVRFGLESASAISLEGYWLRKDKICKNDSGEFVEASTELRIYSDAFNDIPNGTRLCNFSLSSSTEYIPDLKNVEATMKNGRIVIENQILNGALSFLASESAAIFCEFDAPLPFLDFVIESQNRLWGCRYGKDSDGNFVNEIYASALGDFGEWYLYRGISTDSYAVSVGIPGAFTGAIDYNGFPLFFKENAIYKIYGETPDSYQTVVDTSIGVQRGCEKSLCVLDGVLYFRSPNGLMAYAGADAQRVDAALGRIGFENVVCGGARGKLYCYMKSGEPGRGGIYVYDTACGLWHREDDTSVRCFLKLSNIMHFLTDDGKLYAVHGEEGELEAPFGFLARSGVIGYSTPDGQYVSRLALRAQVSVDSRIHVLIEYDSSGVWELQGSIEGNGMQTFPVPVVPRKCDHFRIGIEGEGDCRIFGFSKVLQGGGAV